MDKQGWGERLKERAREMGLSDSAVARLLDMPQRRYSAYANETRAPDYRTLVAICRVLRTSPDAVLGFVPHPPLGPAEGMEVRVRAVLLAMKPAERERALSVLEAMAGQRSRRPNRAKNAAMAGRRSGGSAKNPRTG